VLAAQLRTSSQIYYVTIQGWLSPSPDHRI
jgi:hypothetical protein